MAELTKYDDILFLIKMMGKYISADFTKRSEEQGITASQSRLLLFIYRNNQTGNKIRQVDIEKHFNLSKSTVSGLIKRMENNAIIKRVKEDGSIYLELDEKGMQIVDILAVNRNKVIEKCFSGFTPEERKKTIESFKKILGNFEEIGGEEICGKTSN
ncbi:MAG: MarR family transcriptional regulator [Bacilli bacterium]|nr:MarR family transcriptional regulator [Bacilli bacterium]